MFNKLSIQKRHVAVLCCFGFIGGVMIQSFFQLHLFYGLVTFFILFIFLALFWDVYIMRVILFIGMFVVIGIVRYQLSVPVVNKYHIASYNDQKVTLIGVISKEPDVYIDKIKITVRSEYMLTGKVRRKVGGNVLVTVRLYPQYQYGDRMKLRCTLKKPESFPDFSYDRYLSRYDIYSLCYYPEITSLDRDKANFIFGKIFKFKARLQSLVNQGLVEPHASLFTAIVLGNRRGIPEDVMEQFRIVGIAHFIAISGMHITIIIQILSEIAHLSFISRQKSFYIISGSLLAYLIIIGFPASAVRAAIMGWLVLLALKLGRLTGHMYPLIIVATFMIAHNPKILRDDIGFQLSFAAMVGIIMFIPIFSRCLEKLPSPFGSKEVILMTLSAQITTLPLILYYFHIFSLVSFLVNILVVPLLSIILILSVCIFFITFITPSLGWLWFTSQYILLDYILDIADYFSQFEKLIIRFDDTNIIFVVFLYGVIFSLYFLLLKAFSNSSETLRIKDLGR